MTNKDKSIMLFNGDCLEILKNNDLKFDIIITDLPYGVTQNKIDIPIDLKEMWNMIGEKKPFITTAQQPFTTDVINSNRNNFKYCLYWNKVITSGFLNANRQPLKMIEDILVFGKPKYNPQKWIGDKPAKSKGKGVGKNYNNRNYGKLEFIEAKNIGSYEKYPTQLLEFKKPHPSNAIHPTQKPLELMEWLIKTYTDEGDTVLDLTMGSGTTGVACKKLNRNFIGIEKDKDIFELAKNRINKPVQKELWGDQNA